MSKEAKRHGSDLFKGGKSDDEDDFVQDEEADESDDDSKKKNKKTPAPPPAKKAKTEASHVDLGAKKRVSISSFKGKTYIDIREYYGEEDDLKPGKKGISLTVDQWKKLKEGFKAIDDQLGGAK